MVYMIFTLNLNYAQLQFKHYTSHPRIRLATISQHFSANNPRNETEKSENKTKKRKCKREFIPRRVRLNGARVEINKPNPRLSLLSSLPFVSCPLYFRHFACTLNKLFFHWTKTRSSRKKSGFERSLKLRELMERK